MGTGSPLLGFSRSSIAQLNRSHPYSSRWATVAFYLERDAPLDLGAGLDLIKCPESGKFPGGNPFFTTVAGGQPYTLDS